jgi:hypothetical protein
VEDRLAAYDDTVKVALGLRASDAIVGFIYLGARSGARGPPRRAPGASWSVTGSQRLKVRRRSA